MPQPARRWCSNCAAAALSGPARRAARGCCAVFASMSCGASPCAPPRLPSKSAPRGNMYAAVHAPDAPAALLECAQAFSPVVELAAAHTAVLDAGGLDRIFGHPRELAGAIARRAARLGFRAQRRHRPQPRRRRLRRARLHRRQHRAPRRRSQVPRAPAARRARAAAGDRRNARALGHPPVSRPRRPARARPRRTPRPRRACACANSRAGSGSARWRPSKTRWFSKKIWNSNIPSICSNRSPSCWRGC